MLLLQVLDMDKPSVTEGLQSSNDPLVSLKRIAFDKHIASRIRFKFQNQSADNVEEVF